MKRLFGFISVLFLAMAMATAAIADLPVPKSDAPPDRYLVGVKKIVIRSGIAMDPAEYAMLANLYEKTTLKIDYSGLDQDAADTLSSSLQSYIKDKILIQPFRAANINQFKITDEDILVIYFKFGYQSTQVAGKHVILGAVRPMIWRLPPKQLRGDRTSGFHQQFNIAAPVYPFVLQGTDKSSMQDAIKKGMEIVIDTLKGLLSDIEPADVSSSQGDKK